MGIKQEIKETVDTLHLKKPKLPTVNAVYCFDNSSILICQNPDFRSRHKK